MDGFLKKKNEIYLIKKKCHGLCIILLIDTFFKIKAALFKK